MSVRQIFPGLKFIKKEVAERFLTVTRDIYRQHPVYEFKEDESVSNILIIPSYADTDYDGKQPKITVKAGAYNYNLMDTFNNNMSSEMVKGGRVVGYNHSQIIPLSLSVLVHAYAEEESSDLADELAGLIVYACRKNYSRAGLVIRSANVSETDMFDQKQKIYQTVIGISMDVPWGTSTQDADKIIDSIIPEMEDDEVLMFETYRQPGVTTFKKISDN